MNLFKVFKYITITSLFAGIIISLLSTFNIVVFSGKVIEFNQIMRVFFESIFLLIPASVVISMIEFLTFFLSYFVIIEKVTFIKKFNWYKFLYYICSFSFLLTLLSIFFYIYDLKNLEKEFLGVFSSTLFVLIVLLLSFRYISKFDSSRKVVNTVIFTSYFIALLVSFWLSHNYFFNQFLFNYWVSVVILFSALFSFLLLQAILAFLLISKKFIINFYFNLFYLVVIVFLLLLSFQSVILDDSIISFIYRDTVFEKVVFHLIHNHSKVYLKKYTGNIQLNIKFKKSTNYPDIFLITVDALRSDFFNHLKSLELIKANSTIFPNCYSSKTYTSTSFDSIFTSRYSNDSEDVSITFPQILSKLGYDTNAIFIDDSKKRLRGNNNHSSFVKGFSHIFIPSESDYLKYKDYMLISNFSKILHNRYKMKPKFVWIHLSELHTIHSSEIFNNIFRDNHLKNEYRKRLTSIDNSLSILFKSMIKHNYYNNSIIILTSDHGESIKERGQFFHVYGLYEEYVRIPFLIKLPQNKPLRIKKLISLLDIFPTIIDYLDVKLPDYFLKGRSLLKNSDNKFIINLFYLYDTGNNFHYNIYRASSLDKKLLIEASIVDNNHNKLICNYFYNFCELYNLKYDPFEKENMVVKKVELAKFLKEQLNKSLFLI